MISTIFLATSVTKKLDHNNPDTGEITKAWIFVGVMTYSQYAFVEAFINEQQKSWITAHVHMYEFLWRRYADSGIRQCSYSNEP